MLAVAHGARGRGVGEALVRQCVDRARELGLTGVALSTQPSMGPAHRVYERLGFTRAPERDWQPVPGIRLLAYRLRL
jgi:ribosomal protein S18 acetylase RimI-like enzyme